METGHDKSKQWWCGDPGGIDWWPRWGVRECWHHRSGLTWFLFCGKEGSVLADLILNRNSDVSKKKKKKEAKHFEIQTSFGSRVWNLCWEGYCWPTCSRIWKFLEILPKPRVFLCWHLLPTCMEDLLQPLLMIFYQPYHWESWNHRVYITVWPADTMLPRSASCIFFNLLKTFSIITAYMRRYGTQGCCKIIVIAHWDRHLESRWLCAFSE